MLRRAALLLGLALPSAALAANARVDAYDEDYTVAHDLTWTGTFTQDITILTAAGIQPFNRSSWTFDPDTQRMTVLEAYVTEPDGARVAVEPEGMFTRPSAASRNAPGFTSSVTTTVVFPQLRPGSQTHVRVRYDQLTPHMMGFDAWLQPRGDVETRRMQVEIAAPVDVPLHWSVRGGWTATQTEADGTRHLAAHIDRLPAQLAEPDAVNGSDVQPLFLAGTLPDWEAIGARYYAHAAPKAVVTPELAALAARVVGERTGRAAAEAIYNYVSSHIRYVAVYLDASAGWVPHSAGEVLAHGYGDCKDYVTLMQALLAARGIESEAALIQWGNRFATLPVAVPGQINHAIIYLPAYDVYANPTNAFAPFGTLDHELAGKLVILATPGGRVARTPESTPADYRYRLDSRQAIAADGTADGTAQIGFSPALERVGRSLMSNAPSGLVLGGRLLAGTPEGGFGAVQGSDPRDLGQALSVSAHWRSPHAVQVGAARTYLQVPGGIDMEAVQQWRRLLNDNGHPRRWPLLAGACDFTWDFRLTLPPGLAADAMPPPVALDNDSGSYTASYTLEDGAIRVVRHLVMRHDVVPPAQFPALQALVYAALDDSRQTLVLEGAPRVAQASQSATPPTVSQ